MEKNLNKIPKISVYILNFNYGKFIEKSIKSVLSQTFKELELIIIDDGSTDQSKKLINKYSHINNVRIIYQKNKGLIYSSNIAIKASRGEFVIRLDADDYFDKNAISLFYNEIKKNKKIGIVYSNFYEIDKKNNLLNIVRNDISMHKNNFNNPGHGACCLIRKNFLLNENLYSENIDRQDGYDLWYKFINKYQIRYIELPLFYYRQHSSNLTKNKKKLFRVRSKIIKDYVKNNKFLNCRIDCYIPVRGPSIDQYCVSLKKIGKKILILKIIDDILNFQEIRNIYIISSDPKIKQIINKNFKYNKKIVFFKRSIIESLENNNIRNLIKKIIKNNKKLKPDYIMTKNYQYPYLEKHFYEYSINKMKISNYDKVITVHEDNHTKVYTETKTGIKLVNNDNSKLLKLEKNFLYVGSGGLEICKTEKYLSNFHDYKIKIGKIVIDKKSSLRL